MCLFQFLFFTLILLCQSISSLPSPTLTKNTRATVSSSSLDNSSQTVAAEIWPNTITDPTLSIFEARVSKGLLQLHTHFPNFNMFSVSAVPYGSSTGSTIEDFEHFNIKIIDNDGLQLVQITNFANRDDWWLGPELKPIPTSTIFDVWAIGDWDFSAADALRLLRGQGYPGPWQEVKVLRFHIVPFVTSVNEIFVAFRSVQVPVLEWFLVGMQTRRTWRIVMDLDADGVELVPESFEEVTTSSNATTAITATPAPYVLGGGETS